VAERSQYQYQPVTGPVWREPVADRLAWLPRPIVAQPQRQLARGRIEPFVAPPFEALYKPALQDWTPEGQQPARGLPRALLDWTVYPPRVVAAGYDPAVMDWLAYLASPVRLPEIRRAEFAQPGFEALYKPEGLQWQASITQPTRGLLAGRPWFAWVPVAGAPLYDPQRMEWAPSWQPIGRALPRAALDYSIYPLQPPSAPGYDPSDLAWLTRGIYPQNRTETRRPEFARPEFEVLFKPEGMQWEPRGQVKQVPIERRVLGDFASPPFESLYKPAGLQWEPSDSYYGRALPRARTDATTAAPIIHSLQAYNPATLEWEPSGSAPQIIIPRPAVGQLWAFSAPDFNGLPDAPRPPATPDVTGGWPIYAMQQRLYELRAKREREAKRLAALEEDQSQRERLLTKAKSEAARERESLRLAKARQHVEEQERLLALLVAEITMLLRAESEDAEEMEVIELFMLEML